MKSVSNHSEHNGLKSNSLLMFFLILIVVGCIDPFSLKIQGESGVLVVDGLITDEPGPYFVTLSRSVSYNSDNVLRVYATPEAGAQVRLSDNEGNSELLVETKPGTYRTTTAQGIIGKSYTLSIVTARGKHYKSIAEPLLPVPKMGLLEFDFEIYEYLTTNANGDPRPMRTKVSMSMRLLMIHRKQVTTIVGRGRNI
jgi:hypothetical protein